MTLREIIVDVFCRALNANGIQFGSFGNAPTLVEYRHVLERRPQSKNGPSPSNPDRRVQPIQGGEEPTRARLA